MHRASAVDIAQTIGVQQISDIGQKIRQRHGFRQPADAAAGQRAAIVICSGWLEAARDLSAQRHHERVVDAAVSNIQIRMHTDGCDAVARERKHFAAGEIVRRRAAQWCEDERVVRNNELCAQCSRLRDHVVRDIQRQQHMLDRSAAVTDQKTGVIKVHLIPHRCEII